MYLRLRLSVLAILFFSSQPIFAMTDANAKAALRVIYLAYESWSASSSSYIEPQPYLIDASSKKIYGQKFLNQIAGEKYIRVELLKDSTKAIFREHPVNYDVALVWDSTRIVNVKINGHARCDYQVIYDKNGELLRMIGNEVVNKTSRYEHSFDFNGEKLMDVIRYENIIGAKKDWIRCEKFYEYKGDEVRVKVETYKTGLPNKPDNIVSTTQSTYKPHKNGSYISTNQFGAIIETTYNADDLLINRKTNNKGKFEFCQYTYMDKRLFKEEIKRQQANVFIEHTVTIFFDLPNPVAGLPDYERLYGTYKFNEKGAVIYEARDQKYRLKSGGTWGPWTAFKK